MTRDEALAAAQRRWKERAVVWNEGKRPNIRRCVGYWEKPALSWKPPFRRVRGSGDSWEAAFADAARRTLIPEGR